MNGSFQNGREAGSDPAALMKRLHEGVRGIAARLRDAGKPIPRYLVEVLESTAPLEEVASLKPKVAVEKMRSWLRELASGPSVLPSPEAIRVVRAYRKTQDLSREDAQLLDELEARLKARATESQVSDNKGE